jgi:hypothetical protein
MLIAFPWQQWLRERVSVYVIRTLPVWYSSAGREKIHQTLHPGAHSEFFTWGGEVGRGGLILKIML